MQTDGEFQQRNENCKINNGNAGIDTVAYVHLQLQNL